MKYHYIALFAFLIAGTSFRVRHPGDRILFWFTPDKKYIRQNTLADESSLIRTQEKDETRKNIREDGWTAMKEETEEPSGTLEYTIYIK